MTLPNFLHIGAAKSASTMLWHALSEHPEIYVPPEPDNVNFFTVGYHRGLDWYQQTYFADVGDQKAVGEFSNSYLNYRPALERIARDLPDVRLVMTLRDPMETLFLGWAHLFLKTRPSKLDYRQGIGIPLEKCLHHHGHGWFRMLVDGRFCGRHLENVYSFFPRERVLVTLYDDLCADSGGYIERYFEFLGVDPSVRPEALGRDINADPPDARIEDWVSAEAIEEFRQIFRPDVRRLEEMIGRDLSHWVD